MLYKHVCTPHHYQTEKETRKHKTPQDQKRPSNGMQQIEHHRQATCCCKLNITVRTRKGTPRSIQGLPSTPTGVDFFFSFLYMHIWSALRFMYFCPSVLAEHTLLSHRCQLRGRACVCRHVPRTHYLCTQVYHTSTCSQNMQSVLEGQNPSCVSQLAKQLYMIVQHTTSVTCTVAHLWSSRLSKSTCTR